MKGEYWGMPGIQRPTWKTIDEAITFLSHFYGLAIRPRFEAGMTHADVVSPTGYVLTEILLYDTGDDVRIGGMSHNIQLPAAD